MGIPPSKTLFPGGQSDVYHHYACGVMLLPALVYCTSNQASIPRFSSMQCRATGTRFRAAKPKRTTLNIRRVLKYPTHSMLPRLCRRRRKQRRGYSPRRKPCASRAQGFRPAHECARTIPPSAVGALRASFPENDTTVPAGSAGSLFRRNRPASGMSSSLHSSTARMK